MKRLCGSVGVALLTALIVAGCGGDGLKNDTVSSGLNSAPPSGENDITAQGIYFGSLIQNPPQVPKPTTYQLWAMLLAKGKGYVMESDGVLYVLPAGAITSDEAGFRGVLDGYAPLGEVFPSGETTDRFDFEGGGFDDGSVVTQAAGKFVDNKSGAESKFSLDYQEKLSQPQPLDATFGEWQGFYLGSGSTSISLTVNDDGTITGSDGYSCTLTGQVSAIQGQQTSMFNITITSSGNPSCTGTLTGLGFTGHDDLADLFEHKDGNYLYVGLANSTVGFTAEFFMTL